MATLRLALFAGLLAAGCGGASDASEIEVASVVGEALVVELGGPAGATDSLPAGAEIEVDRLEWTPAPEHEGEHLLSFDVVRDGVPERAFVRVSVSSADPSLEYGGCECGSRPRPPRPRAEAAFVVVLAAYWRRRRAA